MKFSSENRQYFITPISLRLTQIFFSIIRKKTFYQSGLNSNEELFFIIGSGRCGSTLVRSLLITDELIHIPPESSAIPSIIKKYTRYQGLDWKDLVSVCLGEFLSHPSHIYWEINLQDLCIRLQNAKKKDQNLQNIIISIFEEHRNIFKPNAKIIGDKTTFNTLRLQWIQKAFPNAKFINLIRDGRDVVASYLNSKLENDVKLITWKWNQSLIRAESFKKRYKNESNFLDIKYEDLVSFPQKTSDVIASFIGIESINIKMHNENLPSGDLILKHHANVNKDISNSSIGKWECELSDFNKRYVNKHMKINLLKYGYEI